MAGAIRMANLFVGILFLSTSLSTTQAFLRRQKFSPLKTFYIGDDAIATLEDRKRIGREIVKAIQSDSIIQFSTEGIVGPDVIKNAYQAQKDFFDLPVSKKMLCQNDKSYAGYVYSGEEETAGKRDAAEIFTVTRDYTNNHELVKSGVPCHGPVPWPNRNFKECMTKYTDAMRSVGNKVLRLIALGLGMEEDAFDNLTSDSWGHMRVLKFRERESTDLKGIGSHTDYGMLVLATQDHVGGLWVRPHSSNEKRKNNWVESAAGEFENDDGWRFVEPTPNVITCFPGDMLQFITRGKLMSTPHKVELADQTRYALAYFHEPSFGAVIQRRDSGESIQYGVHFTNMFKRCYPLKSATQRIEARGLEANLQKSVTGVFSY